MSQTKQKYRLGKIKQLIDLNGDSTNFDLKFNVTCEDDTPFQVLVVDQTTLDNNPELEYKETKNSISGNIVADKNIYQNYFLILKSEKPCNVDVELIKNELPKTPEQLPIQGNVHGNLPDFHKRSVSIPTTPPFNWTKILLIGIVVIGGVALLWYLYKRKQNTFGDEINKHVMTKHENPVITSPTHQQLLNSHKESAQSHFGNDSSSERPDPRTFKPKMEYGGKSSKLSPDIMSNASKRSGQVTGNTLLDRLRKFAHPS